ncbi:MAG: hypothetical protein RIT28_536 [Pseudomonadota bacterium]
MLERQLADLGHPGRRGQTAVMMGTAAGVTYVSVVLTYGGDQ